MALTFLLPPSLGKAKTEARAELLQQALEHELGEPAVIHACKDYRDLEERALSGAAQIFWAPAAICAKVEHSARAIYKVVRGGHASYRSVVVARRSDDLTIGRIVGLRAAWVDRLSVGGYLLAADHLRRRGLDPDKAFASQTFTGSHPAAATAVILGTADVAAVTTQGSDDASIKQALELYVGNRAEKLAAIAVTEDSPTDGVVLTSSLSHADATRIATKLFCEAKDAKAPSFLRLAMDAEGFIKARSGEYHALLRLLLPRSMPPSMPSSAYRLKLPSG